MSDQKFSEDDVARYWDENAAGWAAEVRKGNDIAREFLSMPAFLAFVGDLRGMQVLDAGCGEGYNTRIFARRGAAMTGVDLSQQMLAFAREEEARAPLGIRYERASYSDLSIFPDRRFDAVISTMALMDGPDYPGAMAEFLRVLRPAGMLAFSITHPCFLTKGIGWIRNERGIKVKLLVGEYFSAADRIERWKFTEAPAEAPTYAVPTFDRTLSQYVNGIIRTGFRLQEIAEPRAPEEYCRQHPSQRGWRDHAALYLFFRATKPA